MSIIRDYYNSFKMSAFVDGIESMPLQYGYINSLNLFGTPKSTISNAIVFDKWAKSFTLLPQVNRGSHTATEGTDETPETYTLKLAHFKHRDRLTQDDINLFRKPGTQELESLAAATAGKLSDMRYQWDQTKEYMQLQALKGIFKTPEGTVMADMFTEFNETQLSVDFLLGTPTTSMHTKILELKNKIANNIKNGSALQGIRVLVDDDFFTRFVTHADVRAAYQYYTAAQQPLRDDLSKYMSYGIMNEFTHHGVTFVSYNASFDLPNGGGTEAAFAANSGIAFPTGVRDLFRAYVGPTTKMSQANEYGQELYIRTYYDDRDEWVEFELESSPLFFCTRPKCLVSVTSSN